MTTATLTTTRAQGSPAQSQPREAQPGRKPREVHMFKYGHAVPALHALHLVIGDRQPRPAAVVAQLIRRQHGCYANAWMVREMAKQLPRGWGRYVL